MHKLLIVLAMIVLVYNCGDTTTTIDGSSIPRQIDIVHKIDLENIKAEITDDCTAQYETQPEIDACVNEKINQLIDFLSGFQSEVNSGE